MHWKTILVPHDFSTSADHALAIARDEAAAHGNSQLLILHVIDLPSSVKPDTVIVPDQNGAPINVKDYAVNQAEARLGEIAGGGKTFVRVGNPTEEILRFVDENKVDLVVMGTHGRSGLAHLLVGSVTERIVRTSKVPVLTIRHAD